MTGNANSTINTSQQTPKLFLEMEWRCIEKNVLILGRMSGLGYWARVCDKGPVRGVRGMEV
jgi:hypothetical protein